MTRPDSRRPPGAPDGLPGAPPSTADESGAEARIRELEARIRSLERSLELALAELSRMRQSRPFRLAARYWALRATVRMAIRAVLHPLDALRPAAIRLLPIALRTRLVALLRRSSRPVAPASPPAADDPLREPDSMRRAVLLLAAIPWGFRRQRPQHLAAHLARLGWDVWYADLPLDRTGREVEETGELAPNVRRARIPAHRPLDLYRERIPRRTLVRMLRALRNWQVRHRYHDVAVICQLPGWAELAIRLREELAWRVVYDLLDRHEGFGTPRTLLDLERWALEAADAVTVTSGELEELARRFTPRVHRLPNAGEWEHWSRPRDPVVPEGAHAPIVGYFGAIAEWFDAELVEHVARSRPEWSLVLVGSTSGGRVGRLREMKNVFLLGERSYEELPALARAFDVAILPFVRNPLTKATDPVKLYELMALGLDVVSTPLPEVARHAGALGIRLAETPEEFVREIDAALHRPADPAVHERRLRFARSNTWAHRAEAMHGILREAFPLASVIVVTYENLPLTRLCLESLLAWTSYPNFEVIVVDNASSDGTPEFLHELAARDPRVRVAVNSENQGFAAACNQGARLASGAVLCFLNNDTVVSRGWLSALVRALHADPSVGLVGATTNEIGNEARVAVGYHAIREMPEWAERWVWEHFGRRIPATTAAFFCAAVRREVWEAVGELDERFGIGMFEDDDYSLRVRKAGYAVAIARDAFVHHWHQAAFRLLGEAGYAELYEANRRLFRDKWSRGGTGLPPKDKDA